jgi:drug/metabolite transporter (DMT)-like permease
LSSHNKGYFIALISTILLSFNFILAKIATQQMTALTFTIYLYIATSLFSIIQLTVSKQLKAIIISRKLFWLMIINGIISAVCIITFYISVSLLDATVASLFGRMQLAFILFIGALFLKERFNKVEGLGLAVVIVGVAVMNWQAPKAEWIGFFWMLACCLTEAIASAICKKNILDISPKIITFYRSVVTMIVLTMLSILTGKSSDLLLVNGSGLFAAILCSLIGPFLGMISFYKSLRLIDMSKTAIVMQITPLFVAILCFIIFRSLPSLKQLFGGAIMIAGIICMIIAGNID